MADGPLITPDSLPRLIPDAVPQPVRQFIAGVGTIPGEALRQAGALANPMRFYRQVTGQATEEDANPNGVIRTLEGAGNAYNALVNKVAGVEEPDVLDDTTNAVARFLGNSLPAAPLRLPQTAAYALANLPRAGRVLAELPLKVAEAVTPLSLTSSTSIGGRAANVAANVAAQTGIAGGVQAAVEPIDPTAVQEIYDADGNFVQEYIPVQEPGAGRVVARGVANTVGEHPYLTAGVGAGLGALALMARRSNAPGAAQRAVAEASDVMRPRERGTDDVPIIEADLTGNTVTDGINTTRATVRNAGNAIAETLQDANIRTKDAIQQVNPERFQSARDAIDIVSPQAHADRQQQLAEQGVLLTPNGERKTESIRRWAESLYHQSRRDPATQLQTKELIILESENDAREYARMRKVDPIDIDRTTLDRVTADTDPANIERVTPRATLWHLSDQEVKDRIQNIRNTNPSAAKYADRYHKLHSDLADAWVDFGILSPQERRLWGRANPNFMHMINMEDEKSPRTYRFRGHREGPQYGGDPIMSALEYQDFMLGHAYTNRMRKEVIESLREGRDAGAFGNSKWLGRVAHPQEIRGKYVPVGPGASMTREMSLDDIPMTGDVVHYYDHGERVHVEVRNKQLLNTLKMRPTHAATFGGYVRQLAQSGMTGKIATLVGQPFSLANAVMGAMTAYITRPKGTSFGMLDAGLQRMTGGKVGVRADPTAVVGMVHSAASDVGAILTRATSEALYNSVDAGGVLSKLIGKNNARSIADYAARRYAESMHAQSSKIGSGNATTLGERDYDTASRATMVSTVTPHGNTARIVGKPEDLKEAIQLYARTVVPADVKIAVRMVNDINEAIGNMAQSFYFRSNYGKVAKAEQAVKPVEAEMQAIRDRARPYLDRVEALRQQGREQRRLAREARAAGDDRRGKHHMANARVHYQDAKTQMEKAQPHIDELARKMPEFERISNEWFKEYNSLGVATRQLLGDSAQMGTALRDINRPGMSAHQKAVAWLLNNTPYANISMQASARLIRAAKENPAGTAAAISMGIVPLAMYPLAQAYILDEEDKKNGGPGGRIAYELTRPSWDVSRYVMIHMRGVPTDESPRVRIDPTISFAATLAREGAVGVMRYLGKLMDDPTMGYSRDAILHIAGVTSRSHIWQGFKNAIPITQVPPILAGPAALAGFELPDITEVGRGARPVPQGGQGGFAGTRLAGGIVPFNVEAAISQFIGGAGQTLVGAINQGAINERRTAGSGAGAAIDEVRGRAVARMPELQPLFNQPIQRATNDPLADALNRKDAVITSIRENKPTITQPDTVGRGKYAERTAPGEGRPAVDPSMVRVLAATEQFGRSMDKLRDARAQQRARMIQVDSTPGQDYVTRLRQRNELATDIKRINAELMARYTRFEDTMSQRLGRRFRIEDIDPTKTVEQFERLH